MGLRKLLGDPTKPVLDLAVEVLTRGWRSGPLDLRETLLIVPTRNAGRRLRERLAIETARQRTAVLMGPTYLPPQLFAPPPTKRIAAGFVAQAFWIAALRKAPRDHLEALCPALARDESSSSFTLAAHLTALRQTLCEEGFSIRTFAERVTHEQERWQNLAKLEDLYLETLRSHGYCDDTEEKLAAAEHPTIPKDVRRVVILFTPDPPPLAIRALNALAQQIPVEICVHADESHAEDFDDWGRPIPQYWLQREIPVNDEQVVVCDDPLDMAERIRRCVMDLPADLRSQLAISVIERVHADFIATILAREGIAVFDPAGRPAANDALFVLLRSLFAFQSQPTFRRFLDLARHPHALQSLEEAAGAPQQLLGILESLQNEHLPATLQSAREILTELSKQKNFAFAPAIKALDEVNEWLDILSNAPSLAAALEKLLPRIYRTLATNESLREAADVLSNFLKETDVLTNLGMSVAEQYALLEQWAGSITISGRRTKPDAVELLGWLELQWEDAPALILSDMNDDLVPETLPPDPFLPNSLRKAVGLRDNDQRYARDAYILMSVVQSRSVQNVRFFTLRRSRAGNPLRPSRLLLQCDPKAILPQRVISLFQDTPSSLFFTQRTSGWRLKPPVPKVPFDIPTISVAHFRSYLECPFLFYLKRLMKDDKAQQLKNELDARDFGSLCHAILAEFARSPDCDSEDENEIRRALLDLADRHFGRKFGRSPPIAVHFQCDIVKSRLTAFSKIQATLRKEGWKIVTVEQSIHLTCDDTEIMGRIDRIDINEHTNRYRIIDYKTSKEAQDPAEAHIADKTSNSLDFATLKIQSDKVWKDLQLPLYALAAAEEIKAVKKIKPADIILEVAYLCLPDDPQTSKLIVWKNWKSELSMDARECARRILDRMRHGVFWPPRKNNISSQTTDSWKCLFFGPIEEYLDEQFVREMNHLAERYVSQRAKGN